MNRNLLLDSSVRSCNKGYMTHRYRISPSSGGILPDGNGYLVQGKKYTITLCITPSVGTTKIRAFVSGGYASLGLPIAFSGSQKQVISMTFITNYYTGKTPQDDPSYAKLEIYVYPNDDSLKSTDTIIHWAKIEEGDMFTGYCPAPEDVPSYYLYEDMFEQGSFYSINNGTYESIKTQSGFNYQIRTKELIPCVGEKIAIHISKGYEYFLNFFSNQTNLKKNTGWKSEDKWWDIPEGADHFALVLKRNPEDTSVPMLPSEIAQICGGGVDCMSTKATASITLAKVDDGVDAFTIVYDSPNGLEFSDSVKSIAITAKVFKGGKELTDAEVAKFGAIKWYQIGVAAAIATGKTLTLTAPKEVYATLEN